MPLSKKLQPGDPIRKISAKLINDICEILDHLEGIGCVIERSGNRWKVNVDSEGSSADVKVAIDADATADYLGSEYNTGALRTDQSMGYTDGGDYITLSAPKVAVDSAATADYLGVSSSDGVLRVTTPLSIADGGNYITMSISNGSNRYEVLSWRADGTNNTWQPDWVRAHG